MKPVVLLLLVSLIAAPVLAAVDITPAQKQSVQLGLDHLASRQRTDGSFGASQRGDVGITALAGLAFMSAGNLPGRGKYGRNVERCLEFILNNCEESGLIASQRTHGLMYGHGFATLFLGEIYGMTADDRVREKLTKAVNLLHRTQNPEGGWRYQPIPYDADISVTITSIMALRAARDGGIKVDRRTVAAATQYVRHCQNPDGGFSYMPNQNDSGFARSAAGVATLYYAGEGDGADVKKGLEYLAQTRPGTASDGRYFYYGHYYAAQVMFLAGGERWEKYYPEIRDVLIARQDKQSGGWTGEAGGDYATAMALIVLQMPNRLLPVFHGKGPGN
jgi:prenyltransferase beta subunit